MVLWYLWLKNNIRSKSIYLNTKSHKHKKDYGFVVTECQFFKQEWDEVNFIHTDTIRDCWIDQFRHLNIDVYMITKL